MNNTFAPMIEKLRAIAEELAANGNAEAAGKIRVEASLVEMCASRLPNLHITAHTNIMGDIIAYGAAKYNAGKTGDILAKKPEAIFDHINERLANMCVLGTDYARFTDAPEGGAK